MRFQLGFDIIESLVQLGLFVEHELGVRVHLGLTGLETGKVLVGRDLIQDVNTARLSIDRVVGITRSDGSQIRIGPTAELTGTCCEIKNREQKRGDRRGKLQNRMYLILIVSTTRRWKGRRTMELKEKAEEELA